jgi:GTP cyclohydrolase FolE2
VTASRVLELKVMVPVTSLCPCSKEISAFGAHNQRSHVTVQVRMERFMWLEELIELVEREASSELYGLLKRPDEKFVTERAYSNPKFVEDLVRDVAKRLNDDPRILAYIVEAENFESIHNHSAYALIERDKTAPRRVWRRPHSEVHRTPLPAAAWLHRRRGRLVERLSRGSDAAGDRPAGASGRP